VESIKSRLARNELIMAVGVGRAMHRNLLQMIGMRGGFHAVWFDHEHSGFSMEELEVGTLAVRSVGLDCFVRIAPTDYALVTKCLEAGGGGVMAAMIHSADQAEQFVRWTKFYPRGARGLNTNGFDAGYGKLPAAAFCEKSNRESFVAIQIETLQSLEECDAIAAINGVDLLFVGPSDLSQSLGIPGDFMNPKCIAAIEKVAAACARHGKHWGAVCANPEHGGMMIDRGCKMLSPASDIKIINAGLQAIRNDYSRFIVD